ncbi:hypothetical protein B566_EDAN008965 [Ephemera danica]|nr:hypothetical protein B566_EDAN008965 [Ephemera danica]
MAEACALHLGGRCAHSGQDGEPQNPGACALLGRLGPDGAAHCPRHDHARPLLSHHQRIPEVTDSTLDTSPSHGHPGQNEGHLRL